MSPGDNQTREFYLSSILDLFGGNLAAEPYLIIATGDNETQCGKLTISLSSSPKKTFGSYMEYGLAGFAYGLGGTPEFINESVTTPWKIDKVSAA
ncbi:MAG: hypothetical protein MZU95_02985 [Desulfomicrobium escambiense]|nr:hypothetical protein [Desulfomicrobium escambiense]